MNEKILQEILEKSRWHKNVNQLGIQKWLSAERPICDLSKKYVSWVQCQLVNFVQHFLLNKSVKVHLAFFEQFFCFIFGDSAQFAQNVLLQKFSIELGKGVAGRGL